MLRLSNCAATDFKISRLMNRYYLISRLISVDFFRWPLDSRVHDVTTHKIYVYSVYIYEYSELM